MNNQHTRSLVKHLHPLWVIFSLEDKPALLGLRHLKRIPAFHTNKSSYLQNSLPLQKCKCTLTLSNLNEFPSYHWEKCLFQWSSLPPGSLVCYSAVGLPATICIHSCSYAINEEGNFTLDITWLLYYITYNPVIPPSQLTATYYVVCIGKYVYMYIWK